MPRPRREIPAERGQVVAPLDRAVAALAAGQYGVVARAQLRALGLSDSGIDRRAAAGRLHRLHRGVYAVGHPVLGAHGRWIAAVLAAGPGAALSHASAAALWELRATAQTRIDVSVPTPGGRARRPGARIHRARTLQLADVTTHRGVPTTTPTRTIRDLAPSLTSRARERLLDQAHVSGLLDLPALDALDPRHRHTPGTTLTKSALEERMLALCRQHGLPTPRVNAAAADLEVDFLFPAQRLAIETDSWTFHRTRAAFERDRERDAILARAGFRVLRFTHRQVAGDPKTVAATVAAALRTPG